MITPLCVDKAIALVQEKFKEIEFSGTESKYIHYIEHLEGMAKSLKESKQLGVDTVFLNQAEVTTLTKGYTQ